MEKTVKVVLFKDSVGAYALSTIPAIPITLAEEAQLDDDSVEEMTVRWVFEEHADNPDKPNAKQMTIKFRNGSPFMNDSTGVYSEPIGTDGAEVVTTAVRNGSAGQSFRFYKYDVEVLVKGKDKDEQGDWIDEKVILDPHLRIKRGTVRAKDLVD